MTTATAEVVDQASWIPQDMLIGGRAVAGEGATMTVLNPGTGEPSAIFPGASIAQFEAAIGAARKAFDAGEWSGLKPAERVAILNRFLAELEARTEALRGLITTETGCPAGSMVLSAQVNMPLAQMHGTLDLYMKLPEFEENPLPLHERTNSQGGSIQSLRRYVPMGVVAGIAAYNFPLTIALWKVFPALATGNTVILRPSPLTPLTALAIGEAAIAAGLPEGVLNVVVEGGFEGAHLLTTHPDVDMVGFTGSSGVGSMVMAQAAPSLKRVQLELGGKSAQIFLPDDVDSAIHAPLGVLMSHAGQGCVLGTRILVPQSEKARVVEAMRGSLGMLRIGDTTDSASTMSPVISKAQLERCERYVALAVDAGATIVAGGKRADRPGYFFEPTILDVPDNKNPAAADEIFGPVVCVIGYRDVDHAIEIANDSEYGLSGYIHSKDRRAALDVALRIRSGTVNLNGAFASAYASSGGHKHSGLGRERGVEGIRVYQEVQCINIA